MPSQYQEGAKTGRIRRYAAKTAAVLTAIALIAAISLPALGANTGRASADHAPLEAIFGTVVAVSPPDSITVATDSGVRTVLVPGNDVFTGDITAIDEISEGDRVVGSIHVDANGITTADKLLIVPDLTKTVTRHILGVILDAQDGVVVIQDRDGNTINVDVPAGIDIPPVGTVVTAVAQLDRATGLLRAQAFDRVEDAVQRIQDAKDRVTDSDLKDELEDLLERARDQHLSALERAREGLERAQQAVSAAIAERDEAQQRLAEVEAQFHDLRQRYVQEASDRNERLPELRTEGTLDYDEDEWAEPSGAFSLVPRINDSSDSFTRTFARDEKTLAIVPVELRETDPETPAITTTIARSVALPLNEVKSLIPSGSRVIVQYDPNTEPARATLITVLPPELPDAIAEALERERLRSINGFITLVEETPDLEETIGVVVVTNREHDVKVAAKVTGDTEIVVDGEKAGFGDLAAGMSVEIEFDDTSAEAAGDAAQVLEGRLNALRIRATSEIDDNEVHVAGVIAGLDPETRTVGILTRDGDVVRAVVLDDAVIFKNGAQARFGALEVGDLVLDASRLNRGTLVLTRLVVQSPQAVTFTGAITGLDRNPDRLTVATTNGRVLVIFVTDATQMFSEDGAPITFDDLEVGERVIKGAASPVQRDGDVLLVGTELVIGGAAISTARGVVSRVDADAGQLRIVTSINASGLNSSNPATGAVTSTIGASGLETDGFATSHIDLKVAEDNRSVMFKNDVRIRSLHSVEAGDIVESVAYVTSSGVIVRMSVVSPNLQRIRGVVRDVGLVRLSIAASNGLNVNLAVTDRTTMTLNGRRIDSLRFVNEGDVVVEAVYMSDASNTARGVALSIALISPSDGAGTDPGDGPTVVTTVSGVIDEISDDDWKIDGRKFKVTPDTRFFGESPRVGLVAKASLVLNDEGDFVATAVSVAGPPDTNPSTRPVEIQPVEPGDSPDLVRILGRVQEFAQTSDGTITVVAIDGVKIGLVSNTVVAGEPRVGRMALAVVRRTPAGELVANSIVFIRVDATATVVGGSNGGDGSSGGSGDAGGDEGSGDGSDDGSGSSTSGNGDSSGTGSSGSTGSGSGGTDGSTGNSGSGDTSTQPTDGTPSDGRTDSGSSGSTDGNSGGDSVGPGTAGTP